MCFACAWCNVPCNVQTSRSGPCTDSSTALLDQPPASVLSWPHTTVGLPTSAYLCLPRFSNCCASCQSLLPAACCLLPAACCLLPAACCLLCLLPGASCQNLVPAPAKGSSLLLTAPYCSSLLACAASSLILRGCVRALLALPHTGPPSMLPCSPRRDRGGHPYRRDTCRPVQMPVDGRRLPGELPIQQLDRKSSVLWRAQRRGKRIPRCLSRLFVARRDRALEHYSRAF